MSVRYEPEVYRRFAENLRTALRGKTIRTVDMRELRRMALKTGVKTAFGSHRWSSAVSSRNAAKTVFLGSEITQLPHPSDAQRQLVEGAPEMLHKVLQLLGTLPFIHIRRRMGDNATFNPHCNIYLSVADLRSWRIAWFWANTMSDPDPVRHPGPELTMIHVPDEHPIRTQILSIPEHDVNIALGTDYTGEEKKGFLRQGMFRADMAGMLGLHAGDKVVHVRNARTGKLERWGVFMFGLTATGKSTWSCHGLGLDWHQGEETTAIQDDICFLRRDGSALGSEQNFYVKTDVDKRLQEAMYYALVDESALLENVMIDAGGRIDFLDERLGENGRAVIRRDKLRIMRDGRLVSIGSRSIDLPPLGELDGIIFAFITRRNTIMPFAQELTPEQGILAYLWGESTHSYATNPAKAGESTRIVGMDDFIVGAQGRKVNYLYEVIMDLCARFPGKVRFCQYNTGGMGEIIKTDGGKKKLVRKVHRVPLDLMAALQRGHLRGTNRHETGRFGSMEVMECEGADVTPFQPEKFYSQAEIDEYVVELVDGRRKHTEDIAGQGLRPEVVKLAEQSFELCLANVHGHVDKKANKQAAGAPGDTAGPPWYGAPEAERPAEARIPTSPWIEPWRPTFRPPRTFGGRVR
jgi:phosphoenolpyruvate carboxykinase (ATP)